MCLVENQQTLIKYDKSIKSQADLGKKGIEGKYTPELITTKHQNGDIFAFNVGGTVTDSDVTVSLNEVIS